MKYVRFAAEQRWLAAVKSTDRALQTTLCDVVLILTRQRVTDKTGELCKNSDLKPEMKT